MIVGYQDASYKLSNKWKGMVWCYSQRREIGSGILIWLKYLFTHLWEQMEHLGILENTSFTFCSLWEQMQHLGILENTS